MGEVQERKVSRIFIHPEYSATALTNDIAVLVLEKPVNFTETVSQACLPRLDEEFDVDTTCVAVGHGKDGPDDSNNLQLYSNTLAAVTLPLWDSVKCTAELNSKHFKPKHDLSWRAHKSHLCAGEEADPGPKWNHSLGHRLWDGWFACNLLEFGFGC